MMGTLRGSLVLLAVIAVAAIATRPSEAGLRSAASSCRPSVVASYCVFLAPFDESDAIDTALAAVDNAYGLLAYRLAYAACTPVQPARDRLGRKGWDQVDCTIKVAEDNHEGDKGCDHGPDGQPCTGTIWQIDLSTDRLSDSHAKRASFFVVLRKRPKYKACYGMNRFAQVRPFTPRLAIVNREGG